MNPDSELPIILARAVIWPLRARDIRRVATELIEAGLDVPELHDIAWDPVIETGEAWTLLTQALPQIGWRLPNRDEAVQILLHHHSCAIVHSGADIALAFEAMCHDVIYPEMSRFERSQDAGTAHDMEGLVTRFYCWDDLRDRDFPEGEMQSFREGLRSNIEDRLRRHSAPPNLKVG